jgi:hypothetical protein
MWLKSEGTAQNCTYNYEDYHAMDFSANKDFSPQPSEETSQQNLIF